jgi:flagellar assembly factor FliW
MKIFIFLLIIFLLNNTFAQENDRENYDDIIMIIEPIELEREKERIKIKSYDDLICTYWTREIDSNSVNFPLGSGYIFLPDNLVLIVRTLFKPITTIGDKSIPIGIYNIINMDKLCSYKIIDGNIVLNLGKPIIYLDGGYLYISHDSETEKYRLEGKFEDLANFQFGYLND